MKYIALFLAGILLSGCGDKFDASSDSMIKISYNNIIKELDDPSAKGEFVRQFALYTQPYELFLCADGLSSDEFHGDPCTKKNDIESLHGLSYDQVVEAVSRHESEVIEMRRQAAKENLKSLHLSWIRTTEGIIQRDKDFVVFLKSSSLYGYPAVHFSFTNKSGRDVAGFWLCLNVTEVSTQADVASDCNEGKPSRIGGIIAPGKHYEDRMAHIEINQYMNRPGYSVTGYLTDIVSPNGSPIYPSMTTEAYSKYKELKGRYPDIFSELVSELGDAAWYN